MSEFGANYYEREFVPEHQELVILARRADSVGKVVEILKAIEDTPDGRERYLVELLHNDRAWHVFYALTECGADQFLSEEAYGAVMDAAIRNDQGCDIISSWENMNDDLFTPERLERLRTSQLGHVHALARIDERFPNIQ